MKVLLVCFSGISNVASLVPILDSIDKKYTQHEFTMLSREFLAPIFKYMNHVTFIGAQIRNEHKGISGIIALYKELQKEQFDVVLDFQNSAYTRLLTTLFAINGSKRYTIKENKKEVGQLIKRGANHYHPLKSIFERYRDLFRNINLEDDGDFDSIPTQEQLRQKIHHLYGEKQGNWIGIAPFSMAKGKTLPFRKTKNVIQHFDNTPNTKLFLFGAGELENELLADWGSMYKNVHAVHTSLNLDEELALMAQLDVMVSMDSGNMHLAALTKTKVISIWGETHPYAGFLGWKQDYESCVGVSFSCRPCTAHHNKVCKYGDYRCLESIPSEKIINKILNTLKR